MAQIGGGGGKLVSCYKYDLDSMGLTIGGRLELCKLVVSEHDSVATHVSRRVAVPKETIHWPRLLRKRAGGAMRVWSEVSVR